jgi:hypothetical protein
LSGSILFSIMAIVIHTPTRSVQRFPFLHILASTVTYLMYLFLLGWGDTSSTFQSLVVCLLERWFHLLGPFWMLHHPCSGESILKHLCTMQWKSDYRADGVAQVVEFNPKINNVPPPKINNDYKLVLYNFVIKKGLGTMYSKKELITY